MNLYQSLEKCREYLQLANKFKLTPEEKLKGSIELAALILQMSIDIRTQQDLRVQQRYGQLVKDPKAKHFAVRINDLLCRVDDARSFVRYFKELVAELGVPKSFSLFERLQIHTARILGPALPTLFFSLVRSRVKHEFKHFVMSEHDGQLSKFVDALIDQGASVNVNAISESVLTKKQAARNSDTYLSHIQDPRISTVSVKLSAICPDIRVSAWDESKRRVKDALRPLFLAGRDAIVSQQDGSQKQTLVYIDMEHYRELGLSFECFVELLDDPELKNYTAGLVLQAYVPESAEIQVSLTEWALERIESGGAPVRIRIVKGANLGTERVESATHGWPVPVFPNKSWVDSQFKNMVAYACQPKHAHAVNVGIGTHNIFDLSYAMLEAAEKRVENYVTFEMLLGMASATRKALQMVYGNALIYCPSGEPDQLRHAFAYLTRRLDENTGPENFISRFYAIRPGSHYWNLEAEKFKQSFLQMSAVPRFERPTSPDVPPYFVNQEEIDFSEGESRDELKAALSAFSWPDIRLDGVCKSKETREGISPNLPEKCAYQYSVIVEEDISASLEQAERAFLDWRDRSLEVRQTTLMSVAAGLLESRFGCIALLMNDVAKPVDHANAEICEAIDFCRYYAHQAARLKNEGYAWDAKGPVLVVSPWNFPISIPAGGIAAALVTGNTVLFKPAPQGVASGYRLCELFWDAGVPRDVLQFVPCDDEPVADLLATTPRVKHLVFTGSDQVAESLVKRRPSSVSAETGGKNTIVVSASCDKEQAVHDIVSSAFGFSGQKCSAASVLIVDAALYDEGDFLTLLKDRVETLSLGVATSLACDIPPLIGPRKEAFGTTLEAVRDGESWLLEPRWDDENPQLLHPGIRLIADTDSPYYRNELFAPILAVIRAKDFDHALHLANATPYGLTAGLMSLSEPEQQRWSREVRAGNLYINRSITGAVVERQSFGGLKRSQFGGAFKAGGPNYLFSFMRIREKSGDDAMSGTRPLSAPQGLLLKEMENHLNGADFLRLNSFCQGVLRQAPDMLPFFDAQRLLGEDNHFGLRPYPELWFRIEPGTPSWVLGAVTFLSLVLGTTLRFSLSSSDVVSMDYEKLCAQLQTVRCKVESEEALIKKLDDATTPLLRYRTLVQPEESRAIQDCCGRKGYSYLSEDWQLVPEQEILRFCYEVSISKRYDRYGNLGAREHEVRSALKFRTVASGNS